MALVFLSGKAKWAKVHKPDEKYGKYSIELGMNTEEIEKFKQIGLKKKIKENEGLFWVSLNRDPDSTVWVDGKAQKAGKPMVINAAGEPFTDNIGNGSDVTVKLLVYTYNNNFGTGKGSRLEAVRVDNLVEYKQNQDDEYVPF